MIFHSADSQKMLRNKTKKKVVCKKLSIKLQFSPVILYSCAYITKIENCNNNYQAIKNVAPKAPTECNAICFDSIFTFIPMFLLKFLIKDIFGAELFN